MIEKFSELNYTIHISFLTGAKPLRKGAAGCWFGPAHRGRATPEWVFLPAILLGLASGAQNFWYFAKEHLDRAKKEKPKRVGFNSHQ